MLPLLYSISEKAGKGRKEPMMRFLQEAISYGTGI
jgi:hypothetical protein